jgi:hypothetical protein
MKNPPATSRIVILSLNIEFSLALTMSSDFSSPKHCGYDSGASSKAIEHSRTIISILKTHDLAIELVIYLNVCYPLKTRSSATVSADSQHNSVYLLIINMFCQKGATSPEKAMTIQELGLNSALVQFRALIPSHVR